MDTSMIPLVTSLMAMVMLALLSFVFAVYLFVSNNKMLSAIVFGIAGTLAWLVFKIGLIIYPYIR